MLSRHVLLSSYLMSGFAVDPENVNNRVRTT